MRSRLALLLLTTTVVGCGRDIGQDGANGGATTWEWFYGSSTSEMDDSVSTYATLYSAERLPDDRGQDRTFVGLSIDGSKNVVFSLEGSSFNCSGGYLLWPEGSVSDPGTCSIRFRFDDSPPITIGGREFGDASQYLGVEDAPKFLEQMTKARRLKAELPVYGLGSPVVVFDVAGFDPQKLAAAAATPSS